jgi:hypothetical protein
MPVRVPVLATDTVPVYVVPGGPPLAVNSVAAWLFHESGVSGLYGRRCGEKFLTLPAGVAVAVALIATRAAAPLRSGRCMSVHMYKCGDR